MCGGCSGWTDAYTHFPTQPPKSRSHKPLFHPRNSDLTFGENWICLQDPTQSSSPRKTSRSEDRALQRIHFNPQTQRLSCAFCHSFSIQLLIHLHLNCCSLSFRNTSQSRSCQQANSNVAYIKVPVNPHQRNYFPPHQSGAVAMQTTWSKRGIPGKDAERI